MSDDITQDYLAGRQTADELDSPASRYLRQYGSNEWLTETPSEFVEKEGGTKEAQAEVEGLQEPWVDPVSAASGGFTGGFRSGMKAGYSVGRSLLQGTTGGAVATATEFPIGAATETVGEKIPGAALPFSVLTGILSGTTIESAIEKRVVGALQTAGTKPTKKLIQDGIENVRSALKSDAEDLDDTSKSVLGDLRKLAASEKGAVTVEGAKPTIKVGEKEVTQEQVKKIMGNRKAPYISEATEEQAEEFLSVTVKDKSGKAYNINLANLETSDDVKRLLQKVANINKEKITKARRGRVSNKRTAELADSMGMTVDELLARRSGQAFNAHEALAARNLLVASAEKLKTLAAAAQGLDASDADKYAFRKHLSTHYAMQAQVSGMTAEAGRALQAFRIQAKGDEAITQIVGEYMAHAGQKQLTSEVAARIAGLDDPRQVNHFIKNLNKASTSDVLLSLWINSLLSGPQTHAVNILSNTLTAIWQIPERLLAAGISKLPKVGSGEVTVGEAKAQAFGLVEGVFDGIHAAKKSFLSGTGTDAFAKFEAKRPNALSAEGLGISGPAGSAVDLMAKFLPTNALLAEDEFFKAIGYRMELKARAYRATQNLRGKERAAAMQAIINDPPDDIRLAAVDAARYQTFTKDLEGISRTIQQAAIKEPILRLFMPFIRTPANIMRFALLERSPVGLISLMKPDSKLWQELKAGGARRDLAMARMTLGSIVMGGIAMLAAEGHITGFGPRDSGMRRIWREEHQPYSVRNPVTGEWHAFNRLEPMGILLGVSADIADIVGQVDDKDASELVGAGLMAIADNITSKTWMRGLSELLELFRGHYSPGEAAGKGRRYIANLLGTVVPTGVAQATREIDPTLRATYGVIDRIKSRIPGYSEDLPPRRNLWGEPIVLQGGIGPDIMSPIYTHKPKDDAVNKEILKNEVSISMPSRVIDGIELTPQQYDRYIVLAGKEAINPKTGRGLHDELTVMINYPEYRNASSGPDGMKAIMIRSQVQLYRLLARQRLEKEYPELELKLKEKMDERLANIRMGG